MHSRNGKTTSPRPALDPTSSELVYYLTADSGIQTGMFWGTYNGAQFWEAHGWNFMTPLSIEPGIYLPDDFGVRSEINMALTPEGAEVTGGEPQRELIRVLA